MLLQELTEYFGPDSKIKFQNRKGTKWALAKDYLYMELSEIMGFEIKGKRRNVPDGLGVHEIIEILEYMNGNFSTKVTQVRSSLYQAPLQHPPSPIGHVLFELQKSVVKHLENGIIEHYYIQQNFTDMFNNQVTTGSFFKKAYKLVNGELSQIKGYSDFTLPTTRHLYKTPWHQDVCLLDGHVLYNGSDIFIIKEYSHFVCCKGKWYHMSLLPKEFLPELDLYKNIMGVL